MFIYFLTECFIWNWCAKHCFWFSEHAQYMIFNDLFWRAVFFSLFFPFLQMLESLSLADSKLKHDTACIINALGSNNSLTFIDLRYTSSVLSFCLPVCLPVSLFVSVCLSVCLSLCPSPSFSPSACHVTVSVCLSVSLSLSVCVSVSLSFPFLQFLCLSYDCLCLPACMSVCWPACLSVCHSVCQRLSSNRQTVILHTNDSSCVGRSPDDGALTLEVCCTAPPTTERRLHRSEGKSASFKRHQRHQV